MYFIKKLKSIDFSQGGNLKNVCVIGLGFVGLTLSLALAQRGFKVFGIEKNTQLLSNLKKSEPNFYEPNLKKILKKCIQNKNLSIYREIPESWAGGTFFITVGTPLGKLKKPRFDMIKKATYEILDKLNENDLIILRSTVSVSTCRKIVKPILDKSKKNFLLSFCPERTAEGNAMNELKYLPQIVSGIDKNSLYAAKNIFKNITKTVVPVSSLETAEMIKIVDNVQRDTFFGFANEIAKLCDYMKVNSHEVIDKGKYLYPRTNVAKPGPVAGPCLTKDTYILAESIKNKNLRSNLISLTARKINNDLPNYIVNKIILKNIPKSKSIRKICLLGVAFKGYPETDDTRNSAFFDFYDVVEKKFPKSTITAFDPVLKKSLSYKKLKYKNVFEHAIKNSDLVIILNDHIFFKKMKKKIYESKLKSDSIIYDCWNLYNFKFKNIKYFSFGKILKNS